MRKYDSSDFLQLSLWCIDRGVPTPHEWALPPSGLIVDGRAVGFLLKADNNCGMLDFFISNPSVAKEMRAEALDLIVSGLINEAKESGLRMVMCDSNIDVIKHRALRSGFKEVGEFSCFKMEF